MGILLFPPKCLYWLCSFLLLKGMKNSIFSSAFDTLENGFSCLSWRMGQGPVAANLKCESSSILIVSLIILERSIYHHKSPACMTSCRTGYIILAPAVVQYLAIWVTLRYSFKGHTFCLIIWVSYLFHYVCCDFPQKVFLILNNFWNISFLPHCMRKLHPQSSSRIGNKILAINCER